MREKLDPSKVPFFTLQSGEKIPAMGIGTFGSDKYSPDEISEAVYGAIRFGYRLIDCAAVYMNEDRIGSVLQRAQREGIAERSELFVMSKVWNDRHREVEASCRQSLSELGLDYLDCYFVHWPFPNYHPPGCDGDTRNPDSRPFSVDEFMDSWRQCETLVNKGLVRYIGMSNMTIQKLKQVLPLCRIKPALIEMELHPAFQQPELFRYVCDQGIVPVGYCPLGSPSRPERDRTAEDIAATEMPEIMEIARRHQIHPALVCLKWAVQRGQIPIPFSVKQAQYESNLSAITEDPLTDDEMEQIQKADHNCRLIKGQVFLWPEARSWKDLWDEGT